MQSLIKYHATLNTCPNRGVFDKLLAGGQNSMVNNIRIKRSHAYAARNCDIDKVGCPVRIGNVAILMFAAAVVGCCGEQSVANREIRLASYNIFHCQGADKKIDFARTAAALGQGCPDFVGLQEVDSVTKRSNRLDQAAEMGKILGMHATYAKTLAFQGGVYGIAILSREKPLSVERIPLPGKEPRVLLLCEFKDCWFGNTHLALQTANQLKSVEIIRKVVAERSATKHAWVHDDPLQREKPYASRVQTVQA